jgi:hypothetical protein
MAGQLNMQPPILDLALYAGDGISFKLSCTDNMEPPGSVAIVGDIQAQIRVDRLSADPPVAEFAADMTNADAGEVVLSLTGEQTQSLMVDLPPAAKGKFSGVWDVQWTPEAPDSIEPRTLCQGKVECVADVTR